MESSLDLLTKVVLQKFYAKIGYLLERKDERKTFVVATPIGNLKDITFRAIETLRSVSVVVAEDTRVSKKLLNHLGIEKKTISNFKENEYKRVLEIIDILKKGEDVALLSDAGTPAISDPGTLLVNKAREEV